jgi:hypoxanthine phosphoribosyltransferase
VKPAGSFVPPAGEAVRAGYPEGGEVILRADEIARRIQALGVEISRDYAGKTPLLVSILKGGIVFLADLMRAVRIPHQVDIMVVSTYNHGITSSGVVRILTDLSVSIEGRHVIIVEDIVDTGLTLRYIRELLLGRKPASLTICALLEKERHRATSPPIEYVGFRIADRFVVGYGLDADEFYRHLPDLVALPETS